MVAIVDAQDTQIEAAVRRWLEEVVIGLKLCPFAARPLLGDQVRFYVSHARNKGDVLTNLRAEMLLLDNISVEELETSLVIVPHLFADFMDYNDFLDHAERLLQEEEREGVYQIASFHPHYQFAGTLPDDPENLTNRAPFPIFHLLREASIERALEHYVDADRIPENNIRRMDALTEEEKQRLFSYLFKPAL